ncbi:zinc metalloprotease HtpX [Candidatus Cerribacteria bacterium 'Amazon FNV 2010 28 9']|uniref:Protease HtpX homolog n=1 Tax=Candidatus Cerribacteria bacterium 'Amazon FNV 2010 28 9' TaxID=2081795 RepID=A0A317JP54_9BACT|nr:MAG: zinc metalloprotease HtpX [Candidatus Cerribacteria bacterium 'Amazon FNV 2010 28 9']
MTFYQQIASNKRRSLFVMFGFIAFITLAVYFMVVGFGFDPSYIWIALIASGLMSFFSYYYSDKMVLSLSGAREANRQQDFMLYTVTENLCLAASIPMPKLYVIEDQAMNAFATGRDPQHAAVCATRGLLNKMDRTELEGVIAHELSHVRNYDTRLMSIVTILVGLVALIAHWFLRMSAWGGGGNRNGRDRRGNNGQLQMIFFALGVFFALFSPLIAQLIQLAVSRQREYLADASGVGLTKYPAGLARALQELEGDPNHLHTASNATAHLFIHSPFQTDQKTKTQRATNWFANLFSTHPPIEDRIKRLEALS